MFGKFTLIALTFLSVTQIQFSHAFERCELKLNGEPIPFDKEVSSDCENLETLEKAAWEEENDSFDEFNARIEEVEVHVSVVNGSIVVDNGASGLQPRTEAPEEELTINYEFRSVFYGRLNIFNKTDACNSAENILQHCTCLTSIRNEMTECLKDLESCFVNNPPIE